MRRLQIWRIGGYCFTLHFTLEIIGVHELLKRDLSICNKSLIFKKFRGLPGLLEMTGRCLQDIYFHMAKKSYPFARNKMTTCKRDASLRTQQQHNRLDVKDKSKDVISSYWVTSKLFDPQYHRQIHFKKVDQRISSLPRRILRSWVCTINSFSASFQNVSWNFPPSQPPAPAKEKAKKRRPYTTNSI